MRGLLFIAWVFLLAFLLWPVVRRLLGRRLPSPSPQASRDQLVKDPVCETYVLRSRAVTRSVRGVTHYFCSSECAAHFPGSLPEGRR